MLRHVAMFKFKEGATQEQKDAARDALDALKGQVPTLAGDDGRTQRSRATATTGTWSSSRTSTTSTALEAYFANPVMNAASDLVASVTQKEITARVQFLY